MPDREEANTSTAGSSRAKRNLAIVAITATVVVVAIFRTYVDATGDSTTATSGRPSAIPAELDGRHFAAVETTVSGRTHEFGKNTITMTFRLEGHTEIYGCGGDDFRPVGGRRDWVGPLVFTLADCDPIDAGYHWRSAYNEGKPTWQWRGNTLTITTKTATARFVDDGAGRKIDEIVGHRFVAWNWTALDTVPPATDLNARIIRNLRLEFAFDHNGTIRAKLGCQSVVVPARVTTGRLRVTGEVEPTSTTDCSPTMAEQETTWLWELLGEQVHWQNSFGNLALRSADGMLYLDPADGVAQRADPHLVAGKTYVAVAINNSRGANRSGLRHGDGITVTIDEDGALTANAGCPHVRVRATVRHGWIRFEGQDGGSRADCPNPDGEGWLGNLFARQPSWNLNRDDNLVLTSGRTMMHLVTKAAYERGDFY